MQRAADQTAWANTTVEALLATAGDEADAIRARRPRRRKGTPARDPPPGPVGARPAGRPAPGRGGARRIVGPPSSATLPPPWSPRPRRTPPDGASRRRPTPGASLEEAEADAAQILERADRRTAESEAGAQRLRSLVADEVVALRTEGSDELRAAARRRPGCCHEAQADAEQSRTQARELLASARAEVSALKQRRDEIAAELSQLSGVIEALAVSESDPEEQS